MPHDRQQTELSADLQITFRVMATTDINGAVRLQRLCFPEPFPEEALWKAENISNHLDIFPAGQFVAVLPDNTVVGTASNAKISELNWQLHQSWENTLGGFNFNNHDPKGNTLYGADISVHPQFRKLGIAKQLYQKRFELVENLHLARFGTACRIPDYNATSRGLLSLEQYCKKVCLEEYTDRTLSPLLKIGLRWIGVIENYMEDGESGNGAALLEWRP